MTFATSVKHADRHAFPLPFELFWSIFGSLGPHGIKTRPPPPVDGEAETIAPNSNDKASVMVLYCPYPTPTGGPLIQEPITVCRGDGGRYLSNVAGKPHYSDDPPVETLKLAESTGAILSVRSQPHDRQSWLTLHAGETTHISFDENETVEEGRRPTARLDPYERTVNIEEWWHHPFTNAFERRGGTYTITRTADPSGLRIDVVLDGEPELTIQSKKRFIDNTIRRLDKHLYNDAWHVANDPATEPKDVGSDQAATDKAFTDILADAHFKSMCAGHPRVLEDTEVAMRVWKDLATSQDGKDPDGIPSWGDGPEDADCVSDRPLGHKVFGPREVSEEGGRLTLRAELRGHKFETTPGSWITFSM